MIALELIKECDITVEKFFEIIKEVMKLETNDDCCIEICFSRSRGKDIHLDHIVYQRVHELRGDDESL